MNVNIIAIAELRKMGEKDLVKLLNETIAAKAQLHLLLKAGHSKKSDTYQKAKAQIAQINTILNNPVNDAK